MFNSIYIHSARKITSSRAVNIFNTTKLSDKLQRKLLLKAGIYVHPSSRIVPSFFFGTGEITIGKRSYINTGCIFLNDAGISIGDDVLIGPRTTICTVSHPTEPHLRVKEDRNIYGKVLIENNVFIGSGVIILPGITISENSVIAANSVVNREIPPNTLYGGNPAKLIRNLGL